MVHAKNGVKSVSHSEISLSIIITESFRQASVGKAVANYGALLGNHAWLKLRGASIDCSALVTRRRSWSKFNIPHHYSHHCDSSLRPTSPCPTSPGKDCGRGSTSASGTPSMPSCSRCSSSSTCAFLWRTWSPTSTGATTSSGRATWGGGRPQWP